MSVQSTTTTTTRDRMDDTLIDVPPGLAGVAAAETEIGDVRGLDGFYHYRQYSATELAMKKPFEDVWHLMLTGRLPEEGERAHFVHLVREARDLPSGLSAILPQLAADSAENPLAALRSGLAVLAGDPETTPLYDQDPDGRETAAIRVGALTPVVLAAIHRLRNSTQPIPPRPDLDHAANYFWMITGREPEQQEWHALNAYLIATIDHGFNASTFTARVIASTGADLTSCVLGALGALSGPLHGGAPSRALETLDAIGSAGYAKEWVADALANGKRIMGFGHPIYRTEDPRSRMLKEIARGFGGDRVETAVAVEAAILDALEQLKPGRALNTNVEYYAGLVMEQCQIPAEMFTPTFAAARVVGWTAHILEQAAGSKIIRPSARYVGPAAPEPVD